MRIALITGVLVLALAGGAVAETSRYERDPRASRSRTFEFDLTLDPFYDPLAEFRDHPNDRGGYRVFIPRGQQGREYYQDVNYRGGRTGRVGGQSLNYYRRANPSYRFGHNDVRRNYWRPGAYTILEGPGYFFEHGYSYPGYSAPTYIFPGNSPVVIDNTGNVELPPREVYNDNRVYDNDVYDNSVRNTYNYAPPQRTTERAQPARPQVAPVQPKAEPIGPQQAVQPRGRSVGVRFGEQGRIKTPDGARVYEIRDSVLYTKGEDGKEVKVASGVDSDFGGYALIQPTVGSTVIFRQGDKLVAAYPTKDGWWVEALNYRVNFNLAPSFSLMGSEPWVTFTATDGTRWVVKLSDHQWIEVGSGTR